MNDSGTRVRSFGDRTTIIDLAGAWTYAQLDADASRLAGALVNGADDLNRRGSRRCARRATTMSPPSSCGEAGAIVVQIHPDHPEPEQAYVVENSESAIVVTSPAHAGAAERPRRRWAGGRGGRCGRRARATVRVRSARAVRSSSTRAERPVDRRASSTRTAHCSRRSPASSTCGVVVRRPHPARAAAAPCARHRQRHVVCAVVGRGLRGTGRVRRGRHLGFPRVGRPDIVHGGSDDLHAADRGVERSRTRRTQTAGPPALGSCA